jgi:GNAT superfamily N-acetyltransferase
MKLVAAEGALLEEIFDLTWPIWHEGLTRQSYGQWNTAQTKTAWARDHFRRFALIDDGGSLLASVKRYRFDARVGGRDGWMCGLGAVFTPPARRGRGHAGALIERVLEREKADGAIVAGLFSEIGPQFYERLGFTVVPLHEVTVNVEVRSGAPAMLVRTGGDSDLPALAAMHESRSSGVFFALRRDPTAIAFALTKKRLFAGLSPPGARQLEFFVAEEGASAVAYAVISQSQYGWTLEEAGDRDPDGARLGALLQVLVAREPALPRPLMRTWWPAAFPAPPQVELANRTEPRDLFMLRALADVQLPTRAEDVFYWRSDYF